MTTQCIITEEYGRNSAKKMVVHDTEVLTIEGRIACSLIERWGMVAGAQGDEDSAGRSTLRLLTPEEVVNRAVDTATLTMQALRRCGYVVTAPDASELLRKTDD